MDENQVTQDTIKLPRLDGQKLTQPPPEEDRVQHIPGGIKGRWMLNSLSFTVAILALVVIFVSMITASYYYTNLQDNMRSRATASASFLNSFLNNSSEQLYGVIRQYVADYPDKDKLEVQMINASGRISFSSSGLTSTSSNSVPATGDVEQCLTQKKITSWSGVDESTGERVLSVSSPLYTSTGRLFGALRFVTSLSVVEQQIAVIIFLSVLSGFVFVGLVIISNRYFIKSIVEPVMKINIIAKEIAAGRYGMRLHKIYDDEIGDLCDTINYMSDEISRAERMKNDFISSVSHELRTPLTAIGGWSETLIAGGAEDKDEVMQGLSIIQKESKRLTQMVEELLDFTRLESGRLKLTMETFDLSSELFEAVYMYENMLKSEGMAISYLHPDVAYFVNGDRHRLKQVFLNIIDNAAKYGKNGGKIEVTINMEEDKQVVVRVRDWGAGIPEKELPFVKERFFKGSSKQRGSGIGLAVTDEIVRMHGGTLTINSRVGEGTCVTIAIPGLDVRGVLGLEDRPE